MSRNSITPSRAFLTIGDLVRTTGGSPFGPGRQSRTPQAQDATGFGAPFTSTRHMRQLPAIDSRSWKQKRGISAPAASQAWSSVYSGGTSTSMPSTMSLVIDRVSHSAAIRHRLGMRVGRVMVDALLDLVAEMPDQALDRPGRRVAERADGVALDLRRDLEQHVDLALLRAALGHARQHAPHPARALAARRALAAALVLVEIGDAGDGADDVGRLVHARSRPRCRGRTSACAGVSKSIGASMICVRPARSGTDEPPGMTAEQVVPAAAHAAAMASRSARGR